MSYNSFVILLILVLLTLAIYFIAKYDTGLFDVLERAAKHTFDKFTRRK